MDFTIVKTSSRDQLYASSSNNNTLFFDIKNANHQNRRAKTSSFSAASLFRDRQFSARKSIAATQRIIIQSSSSSQKKLNNNKRNSALVVRAEGGDDDGFEVPDFVKDLMKPPDASVAAPAWLEPLLGLAKESGDSAVGNGYALMIVTSVFFSLFSR